MSERIYCFTESQLATLLQSARNGDSIPDIMLAIEDGDIEQAELPSDAIVAVDRSLADSSQAKPSRNRRNRDRPTDG